MGKFVVGVVLGAILMGILITYPQLISWVS